jgi:hypothetical protein
VTFLDHVRQVLTDAAPERYPVMIDSGYYSVVAVHDDYADLHPGSVTEVAGVIAVSSFTRALKLATIDTIEPITGWRITHEP